MSATPKEQGQDVAHELMASPTITITQPGYIYIYLSNEETTPVEVYFDDFRVTNTKSAVVQMDDYYPFGLSFNSFRRENLVQNKYLFNKGSERDDALGLSVDFTKYRSYESQTGRWLQVDPKAAQEGQEIWSPYNFSFNNPVRYNDPDGDCIPCLTAQFTAKWSAVFGSMKSSTEELSRLATGSSGLTPAKVPETQQTVVGEGDKAIGVLNDAKKTGANVADNAGLIVNEASKDGLGLAKGVGLTVEIMGLGTPVSLLGAGISRAADLLNEGRQVKFEGKPAKDAIIDGGVNLAIDGAFSKLGTAAKATVSGPDKVVHDKVVSGYQFGYTNLFQWFADKVMNEDKSKK
jgi:RHS repeat-associated protein